MSAAQSELEPSDRKGRSAGEADAQDADQQRGKFEAVERQVRVLIDSRRPDEAVELIATEIEALGPQRGADSIEALLKLKLSVWPLATRSRTSEQDLEML